MIFVYWVCINVYKGMTAQTRKSAKVYTNTNTVVIVCMLLTVSTCSFNVQYKVSVIIHETIYTQNYYNNDELPEVSSSIVDEFMIQRSI